MKERDTQREQMGGGGGKATEREVEEEVERGKRGRGNTFPFMTHTLPLV